MYTSIMHTASRASAERMRAELAQWALGRQTISLSRRGAVLVWVGFSTVSFCWRVGCLKKHMKWVEDSTCDVYDGLLLLQNWWGPSLQTIALWAWITQVSWNFRNITNVDMPWIINTGSLPSTKQGHSWIRFHWLRTHGRSFDGDGQR